MDTATLRPGLLVSLKTSIVGNATYRRLTLEPEHLDEAGVQRARWETERVIVDPAERAKAIKVRTQCRIAICRPCSFSTFGLLCPESKKDELDEAIKAANKLAAEFNAKAKLTQIAIYVIAGRVAANDTEAIRAINSELRGLLDSMKSGIKNLDVKAVRNAANKAKQMGQMLSPEAAAKVKVAIEAAREISRRIVKAGEEAGAAIDKALVRKITQSRTAFLDLDEVPTKVAAPKTRARAVDLAPETAPKATSKEKKPAAQPQLEL